MQDFLDVTPCQLFKRVLWFHPVSQGVQEDPANGCTKLLHNDGKYLPVGVAQHSRILESRPINR
jgi:hypothetical protein